MSFHPSGHDPGARKRARRALAKLNLLTSPAPLLMKGTLQPSVVTPNDTVGYILRTTLSVFTEILHGVGNWTCPDGVTTVTVKNRGAGAGGGSSTTGLSYGAGGGGEYRESNISVTPGIVYPYSCGIAGRPAALFSILPGTDGGNTTFNTTDVVAKGGSGGSGVAGGAGGTGGTGTIGFAGGAGGAGLGVLGAGGPGGGSSADEDGAGNNGTASSDTGGAPGGVAVDDDGAGGNGGTDSVGFDGHFPGGGGGGGSDGKLSGAGADGEIVLQYSVAGVFETDWSDPSVLFVTSVSNVDGTLTIAPTVGPVIASLNLAHANLWTGQQSFTKLVLSLSVNDTFAFTLTTATP